MQTTKWYDYGVKIRMRKIAREYGVLHAAQMLHDAGCPVEVALHFLARHPEPKVLRFARNHEAMHQMLLAEREHSPAFHRYLTFDVKNLDSYKPPPKGWHEATLYPARWPT